DGADVERLHRLRDRNSGGISVSAREGQRDGGLIEGGRVLLRHDAADAGSGTQLQRRRHGGETPSRHREPAVRAALLAESGSDWQTPSPGRGRQGVGAGGGPREDEQVPLHRRASYRVLVSAVSAEEA